MICIPIMARDNNDALKKMSEAAPYADMVEIRLDVMDTFNPKTIIKAATCPVIMTYRSKKEGGKGLGNYRARIDCLLSTIEAGADFVDVEWGLPLEFRQEIFQNRGSAKLIISSHLLSGTPPREKLEAIFNKMAATGADIVKIISLARTPEDNLRILSLIPIAQRLGIKIIAFAMGPTGRMSRIFTLLMGGFLTFSSLEEGQESASGQIPIKKMKKILEMLST